MGCEHQNEAFVSDKSLKKYVGDPTELHYVELASFVYLLIFKLEVTCSLSVIQIEEFLSSQATEKHPIKTSLLPPMTRA
jgi:hypothetical protein